MDIWLYSTIIFILIVFSSLFFLFKSVTKSSGHFKKTMAILFITILLANGFLITLFIFGFIGIPTYDNRWYIFTLLFALGNIAFSIFAKNLFRLTKQRRLERIDGKLEERV